MPAPETSARVDVAIVGAGMGGVSLAAALGGACSVAIIEGEDRPAYHAAGRSAAFWTESYGGPAIQPLTSASGPALRELDVLSPRGACTIARERDRALLERMEADFEGSGIALHRLGREALAALVPGLASDWTEALHEPSCADIDVAALHAHYLAAACRHGAILVTRFRAERIERVAKGWLIGAGARVIEADVLVNAAGAWADAVAALAGAPPAGVRPLRRTLAQLRVDPPVHDALPLVLDAAGGFYFKPGGGGRLWLSPNDETPSPACDAAAEELDVARAIDRLEGAVEWRIEAVERRWAGLRSFAPDRRPVYGFDPAAPNLFWCAGQGGFGIQTAPAASAMAAALLLGRDPPLDPTPYLIDRLR